MATRLGTLLFLLVVTCLATAEAKTLLKGKLFGEYESKLAANHKQVMKTFKSKYTTAKKSDLKSLFFKEDSSSTPVCEYIPGLISSNPPIGVTLCQSPTCSCPTNERCETFADPLLDGLGICACGNSLCTPSSGLNCALTGTAVYTCTSSAVDPYRRSRLMRRALY
jgi:hypothetical protein